MDRIYVMELVRSFQVGKLTRRAFLKQSAAAIGSVAAANALLTACIQVPTENPPPVVDDTQPQAEAGLEELSELTTGIVEYPDTDGETLMGYLAYQTSADPKPAVIVIQEWWGLNDHIKDVANRFAQEGFVALAPDLYHGQVTTEPDEARKLVMELDQAEAVNEIQQAIEFLKGQDYVSGDKAGVVGYCMGGALVLGTALASDDVTAGVVYYGRPLSAEEAGQVKAPILTFLGTEDRIPVEAVEAMHAAFEEAGIENEYHIYEGAQHSFFNDTRESYHAEAAADAWPRTLAWFRSRS